NGKGAHRGSFRRPDGRMGTLTGNRERVWRTADLRLASFDHVRPEGLLLLCAPQKEGPRSLVLSGTNAESADGEENSAVFESQGGSPGARHASGPGGSSADGLVAGSV